jgi:alpha-L-fucosidase
MALTAKYPNLIMNNRLGGGYHGDTETPEQYVPATGFPGRNWESCMTMNDTWGYKSYDNNWKSTKSIIQDLANVASKGGNMLLNVGPTPAGEIPQPSVERLADVGRWMKKNSESIYGTSPSPFPYLSWGRATRKGQKLYLHVFNYPANGKLGVPMSNKISKAYLLTDAKKQLKVNGEQGRSSIQLPAVLSDTMNTVVVVEFSGEPVVAPPLVRGKTITASSRASDDQPAQNLLDGKRQTEWRAAKGERRATLEIDLQKPVAVSSFIADEPWHLWEGKKQTLTLQYKVGNDWKTATEGTSNGTGFVRNFAPVTAQFFRLVIENKTGEPLLLEWQLYGPE